MRQPQEILALLSNFKRLTEVHPLIVAVKESETPPPGIVRRYYITDQLPFGPFRFKFEYRADVVHLTDNEIYTEACQTPQIYVYNLTRVTPAAGGSHLKESVTLKAPDLLFGYVFDQARSAHTKMLMQIKQLMENKA